MTFANPVGVLAAADEGTQVEQVRFVLDAGAIKDTYILGYDWQVEQDGSGTVSWHLVEAQVLKAMEGAYVLEPTGEGTEVTLRLPAQYLDTSALPTVGTVLLVDDDEGFRERLKGMLGDLANTVVQAADGRAGLDLIADQRPDLVFLDLSMPVMGGRRRPVRLRPPSMKYSMEWPRAMMAARYFMKTMV